MDAYMIDKELTYKTRIARKVPAPYYGKETYAETAERYGLTEVELRQASLEFLECEGYRNGKEHQTLRDWLIELH